jgi:hypothetical protein
MAKFLYGKVTVLTLELDAESKNDAEEQLEAARLSGGEGEDIKKSVYKLAWTERNDKDPSEDRNRVLAEFLNLMQNVIPGIPQKTPSRIILPFEEK